MECKVMEILKLTTHRARKAYTCNNDKTKIQTGEVYARGFAKTDKNIPFEFFLCEKCLNEVIKKKYVSENWLRAACNKYKRDKKK